MKIIMLILTLVAMVLAIHSFMEKEGEDDVVSEVSISIWGALHLVTLLFLDF
jgi:hypothetical protein